MVSDSSSGKGEGFPQKFTATESRFSANGQKEERHQSTSQTGSDGQGNHGQRHIKSPCQNPSLDDESKTSVNSQVSVDGNEEEKDNSPEKTVWIRCDVYDTGIGIPGNNPLRC